MAKTNYQDLVQQIEKANREVQQERERQEGMELSKQEKHMSLAAILLPYIGVFERITQVDDVEFPKEDDTPENHFRLANRLTQLHYAYTLHREIERLMQALAYVTTKEERAAILFEVRDTWKDELAFGPNRQFIEAFAMAHQKDSRWWNPVAWGSVKAYKQLLKELTDAPTEPAPVEPSLHFSGTKIELLELLYGLWLTDRLKNADGTPAQLQRVVQVFEQFFSKELTGNVSDELNRALKAHKRAQDGKYFTQEILDALKRRSSEIQEGEK